MTKNFEKNNLETHEQKELEYILESLPVYDETKADLILASGGFKKATDFQFSYKGEELERKIQENKAKVENLFKKLGLQFIENSRDLNDHFKEIEYIVGKKQEDILELQELWNQEDDFGENAKKMGKIFGFPETSIDAYVNREKILEQENFPENIRNQDYMAFAHLKFSKDNYKNETETVKKWAEAIKNFSPNLYKRMIEEYRENLKKGMY